MLTADEKSRFCSFAAALVAPPDEALIQELQDEENRSLLMKALRAGGSAKQLPALPNGEGNREEAIPALRAAYDRLFGQWGGAAISLVESTYKPWTTDEGCRMVFSRSTGLLMGDAALHMQGLYRQSGLDVPEEFAGTPDHLVLELEFLGLLYLSASQEQISGFIADHLDWIPGLQTAIEQAESLPFYRDAVELIRLFLESEKICSGNSMCEKSCRTPDQLRTGSDLTY